MVNDSGQLYTIEGIAAGALMIVTAYLVLNTTTILTPGDIHVNDMQLEQLGNDVLQMMDTPDRYTDPLARPESDLEYYIRANEPDQFDLIFTSYCNNILGGPVDHLNYKASFFYRNLATGDIIEYPFKKSQDYAREHAVKVTRWVFIKNPTYPPNMDTQSVLLEVLLWRD